MASRTTTAALIGLLAGGVAVGVGELVAALVRPAASPVIAVGNRLILLTPEPVKRWAIRQFGTGDKHVLLTGIYLVLAGCAVAIGIVAVRRLRLGLLGVGLLGLLGVYSSQTTAAHRVSDAVPSALGVLAGMAALWQLVAAVAPADDGEQTGSGRRSFLAAGLTTAVAAVLGGFGGRALQHRRFDTTAARAAIRLPAPVSGPDARPSASAGAVGNATATNYDRGLTSVPFRTPADRFYRIDTALAVPQIDPDTWKLRITGMVARPLTLTFADLLARPLVERWITLCCVSNEVGGELVGNATFRGVLLADLLREAGIASEADQLVASSSDGMTIGSPTAVVMDGRDAMLAVGMNGEPLTAEHGFPVRMVVPGLYGYVSACKWITG
ncbi:molybdopterin-dependent oxidoreductase, partial [Jatrophihabitans sp.]|uniref:molybdopterin-dependent oxidoreductase n=1 Tax=Jatrophihabitans sp. TaxID=1932789 RepID=UPI002C26B740|nr:molybdopterin-dependent oxidoreductase [Jatrophihabitans sp.]